MCCCRCSCAAAAACVMVLLLVCCCCSCAAAAAARVQQQQNSSRRRRRRRCRCCCCGGGGSSSSSNFLICEIEAAEGAAPAIFGRYLLAQWRSYWRPPLRLGRNIGYNLGDKAVFPPANYHLLRRYKKPCAAIISLPETISRP